MKIKKEWIGLAVLLIILGTLFAMNREVKIKVDTSKIEIESDFVIATYKVYISGEVLTPGVYEVGPDDRLNELVTLAGGFTDEADISQVNLARILKDGEMIVIYKEGDTIEYIGIDVLNFGDLESIKTVEGIGEVLGGRIIKYREDNGLFGNFDELLNVEGIGEQKLESIETALSN